MAHHWRMSDDDDRIEAGVRALIARFEATQAGNPIEHLRIVDDAHVRTQFVWLKRHRRDLWDELRAAILASWHRVYPQRLENGAHARRVAEVWGREIMQRLQRKTPR
jgi:hypothetical protein